MTEQARKLITIFGGSGFVGTQLVQALARSGHAIRVAVRRPDLAGHVRPLGAVGQIQPIQANIRNADSVMRAVQGADIVINLTGILYEKGKQRFRAVHTAGARTIAETAKAAGAERLIHMSGLGASAEAPSALMRSKAAGEAEVLDAFPEAIIFRPSVIFGMGDDFFNMFGMLAQLSPVLPVIAGDSRFQPVHVGDVAAAMAAAALGAAGKPGTVYELGGPEIETMRELMQRVNAATARNRLLLPIPTGLARLKGAVLGLLPKPLLTADQVDQLGADNVVGDAAISEGRTFAAFGIAPVAMEAVLPSYMWQYRRHGQFDRVTA